MPQSKAHMQATQRYEQKAYDKVLLRLKKGERDIITAHATGYSESLNGYITKAIEQRMERESATINPTPRTKEVGLYELPAAAGAGEFLDSDRYTVVKVDERVPSSATFGVRISGDSMEPDYPDGYIAWVRHSIDIDLGKVGVFVLNGTGYIKKMGHGELLSLNPAYEPIRWNDDDSIRVSGIVVGVTQDVFR
ncbi:MAG: S24 family peptidase [Oscillospiraceae bacterium]|nr:S24 family peptidase [Oscillospiraceae bacterium]